MDKLQERLFSLQDEKYRDFQRRLMPTVAPERVIGVRTPVLRALAGELSGTPEGDALLRTLPHKYYEENNLHSMLICRIKDFERVLLELERFLPYVDNWATCDGMTPRAFKKRPEGLMGQIDRWLASSDTYTVRFGVGTLMGFYLDEGFDPAYPERVAAVKSEEYYVNMMRAWYFATALAKQYDATIPYIEKRRLDAWTHGKTIQKAIESFRITDEQKEYLRSLK